MFNKINEKVGLNLNMKRVVVTGVGAVTPLGNNVDTTWENILDGVSGIGPLTRHDPNNYSAKTAAEIKDFAVDEFIDKRESRKMDRFTHYAIAAAKMALTDASLIIDESNASNIGVWIGSGIGGMETLEKQHDIFLKKGYRRVSPFFIPMLIPDMASGQVSIHTGAKGPNSCTVTACATGTNSIGDAFRVIQRGEALAMIAGGAEAPITKMSLAGFCANNALSTNPDPQTACRPFDKERDGFVMGEGSGIVVLEELESARARGAKIYAELVGYGSTGDAHHITSPAPDGNGAIRAMQAALKDGNIAAGEVGYINAHGTSTQANDFLETKAIKYVFGQRAYDIPISSTKSMTGHLLGAAGGIEAIFSVLALRDGILPPTININNSDPECDLFYIPTEALKRNVSVVLTNSFGFGGHNASLVFKKFIS